MKLFSTSLVAVSALAGFSYAWDVTSYRYISDCRVHDDGAYRYYEGSDSKTCHNLAGGDSGASCTQYTNGGDHHANCDGERVGREATGFVLAEHSSLLPATFDGLRYAYITRLKLATKQVNSGIYRLWEAEA
ncbi:uncharacterized protein G6M90_00g077260 [Metarhizium brunneum]|uniref:Uncharacterized protein n=1 Tax=Metarhizium brunneum TaxID=500148 RepID=A0A7D5V0Q1_9HYPO|nr:hypothetical protein G6M90_00g077260 [Metarhizium brunneum]